MFSSSEGEDTGLSLCQSYVGEIIYLQLWKSSVQLFPQRELLRGNKNNVSHVWNLAKPKKEGIWKQALLFGMVHKHYLQIQIFFMC